MYNKIIKVEKLGNNRYQFTFNKPITDDERTKIEVILLTNFENVWSILSDFDDKKILKFVYHVYPKNNFQEDQQKIIEKINQLLLKFSN